MLPTRRRRAGTRYGTLDCCRRRGRFGHAVRRTRKSGETVGFPVRSCGLGLAPRGSSGRAIIGELERVAGEDRSVSGLAGRYVAALFELADEQKALDQVAGDLTGLKSLIEESPELRRLMLSPLYGRDQQVKAMDAVLAKASVSALTRKFVLVVAENRRLFALRGMIDGFLAELARRRGEVTAQVTVARPLTDAQAKHLEDTLKASVGGKVRIETRIDESLIGGLIVQVGSRMVDGSLKTKLQKLQNAMKGV